MNFKSASSIEEVVWNMKYADLPRSANRARINSLFNGERPFTDAEQKENKITVNVNFLDATRIALDANRQYSQAFLKPANYFKVTVDRGPAHKRLEWGEIITKEINKRMKKSTVYTETLKNVFAQLVLHGVGPVTWGSKQKWCPTMHMMGDVLLPSRTLRSMENLPYFGIFRRYTASQLIEATSGKRRDAGWNMDVVNKAIKWAYKQRGKTTGNQDTTWSPEKIAEDIKADTGLYASDQVPTIDCWDFYFKKDSDKEFGWKRRIVLDTPSEGAISNGTKNILEGRNEFLFDPGNRNYASRLGQILHFQFGDGSIVAPFRYHSVRSLGILLYAVCFLQNRLRCKFNDSVFESLLQYFRVANPENTAILQQIDLIAYGIIPDGLNFVTSEERWQIKEGLVNAAMNLNRQSMAEQSSSFTQDFGLEADKKEKTATQVAAEVNAANAMVGGMLQDAYVYQTPQYEEICRRFCIPNSSDLDVREFRKACLKQGVPEEILDAECWDVAPVRVVGNGNKTVELAQVNLLMQHIDRFDPDSQRIIMRMLAFASSDNPSEAALLVPENKTETNDSVHDAQMSAATLLMGLPMGLKQGVNHGEYAATLIGIMNTRVQSLMATGMATAEEIAGLQNIAGQTIGGEPIEGNGAANHIAILAMEKSNMKIVKALNDFLGDLMNQVKAFAQRLQEQQGSQNGQLPPEDAAKLKGEMAMAEVKAELQRQSGELKLVQKQQQHEQKLQQADDKHKLKMAQDIRATQVDETVKDLQTAGEIRREGNKTIAEQAENS